MSEEAPPAGPVVEAELRWDEGTFLAGRVGGNALRLDWNGREGVSPVQALVLALAGCMASDVVLILTRGRQPLRGLTTRIVAERAPSDPKRLLRADIRFAVEGEVPGDKIERAIALSKETYCSVWHSLAPDIALTTSFEAVAG